MGFGSKWPRQVPLVFCCQGFRGFWGWGGSIFFVAVERSRLSSVIRGEVFGTDL